MSKLPPANPDIAAQAAKLKPTIHVESGSLRSNTDDALAAMRADGQFYDYGASNLVRVVRGQMLDLHMELLQRELAGIARFTQMVGMQLRAANPPTAVAKQILAMPGVLRELPVLHAVTDIPTLRADGTVLGTPGYDQASGIYYHAHGDVPRVPDKPSKKEVLAALEVLWSPFALFEFEDADDRAVVLAALITGVVRAALDIAPAFAFDAHTAGVGKTLLANCVNILATGVEYPDSRGPKNATEMAKQIYAALLAGRRVYMVDNQNGKLGNPSLSQLLTAPRFVDRTLGVSEERSLPNKMLVLFTGNNIEMDNETARRVLTARIVAAQGHKTRTFPFVPTQVVFHKRIDMVVAALTVVRGYIASGEQRATASGFMSYTQWDRRVRQPLMWAARLGGATPFFGDPTASEQRMADAAPENEELDRLIAAARGLDIKGQTAVGDGQAVQALAGVLREVAPGYMGDVDPTALGSYLRSQNGKRRAAGWVSKGDKNRLNQRLWRVEGA